MYFGSGQKHLEVAWGAGEFSTAAGLLYLYGRL